MISFMMLVLPGLWLAASQLDTVTPMTIEQQKSAKAVMQDATTRARSNVTEQVVSVFNDLRSEQFLLSLDSEADYADAAAHRLRVSRVVEALARNTAPNAQEAFLRLLAENVFIANDDRVDALIMASAFVSEPDARLSQFWNRFSQSDDGYTPLTITALLDNGAPEAIAMFEQKMVDESHESEEKTGWLYAIVVPHRDDANLLEGVWRLLHDDKLSSELKLQLVEVLFDYRPEEWYRPASVAKLPDRAAISMRSRELLINNGEYSLASLDLPIPVAENVRAVIADLREP
jgi:hypothetical protein